LHNAWNKKDMTHALQKVIQLLHQRPWLHGILLLIYCLCVILPHEEVGLFVMSFLQKRPRAEMVQIVLTIVGSFAAICFIPFFLKLRKHPERQRIGLYLVLTLGLIVLTYQTLFVLPTETAHFPQYAVMAILLFPFTYRMDASMIWATLIGVVDEGYQYYFLAPERTNYYDFNDVVTDLLGAAIGLIYLWVFVQNLIKKPLPIRKSAAWLALGIFCLLVILLYFFGDKIGVLLVRVEPTEWWTHLKNGVVFHILRPLPGDCLKSLNRLIFSRLLRILAKELPRNKPKLA